MTLRPRGERPLLTIAVPTYNRLPFLRDLMDSLVENLRNTSPGEIEVLVSDNASNDGTEAYVRSESRTPIRYIRNTQNIGGDANFLACIRQATGEFVWLLGDDELLEPGCVDATLKLLVTECPALLVHIDADYRRRLGPFPREFKNYAALVRFSGRKNAHFVLAHTLISANIFRRDVFDFRLAEKHFKSNYGHMYGMVFSLTQKDKILVPEGPSIHVRDVRAEFQDLVVGLEQKQALYLLRLGVCFTSLGMVAYSLTRLVWLPFTQSVTRGLARLFRKVGILSKIKAIMNRK